MTNRCNRPAVTPDQAQKIGLAVAFAQTAYSLNNGGGLVVGQPVSFVDDSAALQGSQATPLHADIPPGFVVQAIVKDNNTSADAFVAADTRDLQTINQIWDANYPLMCLDT